MLRPPSPDEVEVWTVPLGTALGTPAPGLGAYLDEEERARAACLRDPLCRTRFVTAHAALRAIVGARLGHPPDAVRFTRGPFGKPEVEGGHGLFISLSHSDGIGLVALAGRPVGVDVERLRSASAAARIAERFFPPGESEVVASAPVGPGPRGRAAVFARLWTRKEACVKAEGGRLCQGLRLNVRSGPGAFTDPGSLTSSGPFILHGSDDSMAGPWSVADLAPARGYAGAVALSGSGALRITVRSWQPPARRGRGEKSTSFRELTPV